MLSNILITLSLYCASFTVLSASRPGEVEASDPLYLDEIVIEDPNFKFVFSKAKMTGLQCCTVKDVLVTSGKAYFIYQIWCPSITVGATFEANGEFDGISLEGKGTSEVTFKKYDLWLKGDYDRQIDAAGDLHTQVTNFDIEISAKEVSRNVTGLCFGGQKSTDGAFEEQLKQFEIHV